MAYTGVGTINTGTTSAGDLSRDVQLDVLASFQRSLVFAQLLYKKQVPDGASGAQFIIEGKEDDADTGLATYTAGAQVDITNGTQDERLIALDRPFYQARRIDRWDAVVANYDSIGMNVRQMGAKLGASIDRKAAAAVEAASLATGLANNGNGVVVTNTALPGGLAAATTAAGLGNEIAESIFASVAAIRDNDDEGDVYIVMNPTNYSYLVQSDRAVNSDFTNGNGGFDTGSVKTVGGAYVFQSNNVPATAGLIALAFTEQAAGISELWGVQSKIGEQQEFLDAKLLTAYYSNGMGVLRANSAVSIKNV